LIYLIGLLLFGASFACGYFTDHTDFKSVLANTANWLALLSFILVLYISDTLWRYKFERRRTREVKRYSARFEGYCKEFGTFVTDYANSEPSISVRLPFFKGEVEQLSRVLFLSERRELLKVRIRIWMYETRRSKIRLVSVLGEMNRLHARIQGWERDNAED
jgi:hypothetical protein